MNQWRKNPGFRSVPLALCTTVFGIIISLSFPPEMIRRFHSGGSLLSIAVTSVFLLAVVRIIALRSRQDSQLQIDHDLLEAFLKHIPDNVFFKDRNSRFVRISRAMADYIGLSDPKLAVGKLDSDIFSPEHASQALADECEIIRTGQPQIGVEEKETWPDGRESWVLTNKLPLTDHRGQIVGTMGIARNITDWKLAEQRL